ncbi:hypothetical protein D8674_028289 [Pyrus ussuriensis x Pyrus communis]|uniref:Uncharacterized protein n=1 Tax=Pyrus ussuriensis x Pyrus communis TaxID=2448454 RepID=A0A5N5I0W3_9ROSA|nr:hypothetical protein D8674_028289 [Pyrus ussuriensis x Pyrus communis]
MDLIGKNIGAAAKSQKTAEQKQGRTLVVESKGNDRCLLSKPRLKTDFDETSILEDNFTNEAAQDSVNFRRPKEQSRKHRISNENLERN